MNIYIGNINYKMQENDIMQLFSDYGNVTSVKIIRDKKTGRSKGYGFIEMDNSDCAVRAVDELHRHEVLNRKLVVSVAKQSQVEIQEPEEEMA